MLALKRKGEAGKKHGAACESQPKENFPHLPVLALKLKPILEAQAKARQHTGIRPDLWENFPTPPSSKEPKRRLLQGD